MKNFPLTITAIVAITFLTATALHARGFGGSFGGGFHAGGFEGGGFHAGEGAGGGFHADNIGGYHPGGYAGGGYHPGNFYGDNFRSEGLGSSGYHPENFNANNFREGSLGNPASRTGNFNLENFRNGAAGNPLNRNQLNNFLGLPTDSGLYASANRAGVVHPEASFAGHNLAPGEAGMIANRSAMGVYGTHYFSPSYCHAQGLAAQHWFYGCPAFRPSWNVAHPWAWTPAGVTAAAWTTAAWTAVAWPAVGTWFAWDAAPVYYNYGENVTYENNQVYYGSQPVGSEQQYYQSAVDLASQNTSPTPDSDTNWLPLGVFGLMAQGESAPEMLFQLAVNKAGVIRGNYYDKIADTTMPVTGSVDKKTQKAAWYVGSNKTLIIETGLYNLTQDQSTALVHYSPKNTRQYVLVRLKKPEE